GSTYRVQATSTSGKSVTFSVDATPANACAIDGDLVSFDHAGTCVITGKVTAKQAARVGGAGAAAGPSAKVFSQTVVIPKGRQDIDFHGQPAVDGPPLTATGGPSGTDVPFTSEAPDICSLNADATKVRFHHAQKCIVVAHQDGNEDYKPVDDRQSFDVDKGTQTIDFDQVTGAQVGTETPLHATSSAEIAVTFDTTDTSCTVQGSTVSFVHARPCVVTASAGNADYKNASVDRSITIAKGDQTVTFVPVDGGQVGTTDTLQATSSAGIKVGFSTDDTSCSVAGSTISYDHAQPCRVTASAGNDDWNPASDAQTIQIAKGDQTIDFAPVRGQVGTTATLKASSSAGLEVTFSTSDPSCTVTGSTVTYDHAVPCTVTAAAGNADWNTATTDQTVDVAKGDQTIDFTRVSNGQVGTSTTLQATSSAGLDVTFATNDASCTVLGSTVSFAHAVPCVVTAKQGGNDDWNDTTTDQTIEIAQRDQTIDSTPVTGAKVGTGSPLQATTNAGLDVTFSSTSDACTVT